MFQITSALRTAAVVASLLAIGWLSPATADPIVTINDDFDALPDEAFFAANPAAVVNVEGGGVIFPWAPAGGFNFGGATVNINPGGQVGTRFTKGYSDNVTMNVAGGKLEDGTTFTGLIGETLVTMTGGTSVLRMTMEGNSRLVAPGGVIGVNPPGGVPSLIAKDDAIVTLSGAVVEDNVQVEDRAALVVTGGSVANSMSVRDDAVLTVTGGSVGRWLHGFDNSTINITGGTIGRDFTLQGDGVVNLSGGGLEQDAGILSVSNGVFNGVFNIRGGAVAEGFRAFGGKVNVMGGVIGDRFRLGAPGRNGRGGNAEIFATSATIDAIDLLGSRVITEREAQFLSADLALGGTIGLSLTSSGPPSSDVIYDEATLTVTLVDEPGDFNGDGDFTLADYTVWRDNLGREVPYFTRGDADGSGVVDDADYAVWAAKYTTGASGELTLVAASAAAIPEPQTLGLLAAMALASLAWPRR